MKYSLTSLPSLVLILLGLSACQSVPPVASSATAPASEAAAEPVIAEQPPAPAIAEVPIPPESLLPLLHAEFLLRERDLDGALEILTAEALRLGDPALTRRALRLAEFRQDDARALALAIKLSEQDSNDAAAAVTAMGLLIRAGEPEEALVFARTAKARGARINAPALLVSWDALEPDKRRAVATAVEALASDWPEDQDIAIAVAYLRRAQDDPDRALAALEPVLSANPDEERALLLWSQIKLDSGANRPFEKIREAVARNPDNEALRLQFARLLASASELDEAREQFAALLTLSPRNGDYLFSLALIEIEANDPEAAKVNLQALVDLGQRPDEAQYYLGRVYENLEEYPAAIAAYDKVGPSREFFDATRRAAELRLDSGDTLDFRDGFRRTRARNPGQAEQLYSIEAELLNEIGETERAIQVYTEALDLFPESMSLRYGRAMAHETLDDIPGMEGDLRAILKLEPNNATTLNALGYTLTVHTTRYEEAATLIEKALELSPGEPAILDSLGWVYFKLGRLLQAVDLLKEAYALFPDPEVAAHLGEALWVSGREQDALVVWRASLEREPEAEHVTDTLLRLGVTLDTSDID